MWIAARERVTFWLVLGLLLIAPIWLTACGSSSTATLSKSQFLKEGNQICRSVLEEKDQAVEEAFENLPAEARASDEGMSQVAEEALFPAYKRLIDELAELDAPAKDEKALEAILESLEKAVEGGERDPAQMLTKNPFAAPGNDAQALGLKSCTL